MVAGGTGAGADTSLPLPLPVPVPVELPPLPVPLPGAPQLPVSLPTAADVADRRTPVAFPEASPRPTPVCRCRTLPAVQPQWPVVPTRRRQSLRWSVVSRPRRGGGLRCDAAGTAPTQAGTTAFVTAAGSLPPEVTAALVPLLASAASSGGAADLGTVCSSLVGTVTGVVGGVVGTAPSSAGTSGPGSSGTASPANAKVAAAPTGSSGGASLAFTGAETWVLALAGIALALTGLVVLGVRLRLARRG